MPSRKPPPPPDLKAMAEDLKRTANTLGREFQAAFAKIAEDAQYEFDKGLGKALAQHPELYADVKKTIRQVQKTVDKAAKEFGLKEQD